jgi:hypothetical protein
MRQTPDAPSRSVTAACRQTAEIRSELRLRSERRVHEPPGLGIVLLLLASLACAGCYNEVTVRAPELRKLRYADSGQTAQIVNLDGEVIELSSYEEVQIAPAGSEEAPSVLKPPVRALSRDDGLWLYAPDSPPVRVNSESTRAVVVYRDGGRTALVIATILVFTVGGLVLGAELTRDENDHCCDAALSALVVGASAGLGTAIALPATKGH